MTSDKPQTLQTVFHGLLSRAIAAHDDAMRHVHDTCAQLRSNLASAAAVPLQRLSSSASPRPAFASIASTAQRSGPYPSGAATSGTVSKEQVGRAAWTFLHALAAQYPDKPSRQQVRDVTSLLDIFTRMYPCADCARHFNEIVRASPVRASSRRELQLWMCEAHNAVNRSLGKPSFNCALVEARWGALDCDDEAKCSLAVGARR